MRPDGQRDADERDDEELELPKLDDLSDREDEEEEHALLSPDGKGAEEGDVDGERVGLGDEDDGTSMAAMVAKVGGKNISVTATAD
jgi:hypothetical protein